MAMVKVVMNGKEVRAPAGSTVLDAAEQAGIDIPTLCHHPAVAPIGACRMCLVEIKGQRVLQPACTFPISEGMEVQTESPRVVEARKFVLELLFSERNHYCMYCEMTGDCELQALGYRYGIDHWVYPTYTKRFPVDATRDYFLMDHNRCILCRRCVRACSQVVANHTLGVVWRGANSMIHADMNVPLGESSCISCGTCLQVCPTGALVDRRSAFMGRDVETEHVRSICTQCSIGCGIEIVTRAGNVLRVEGDWDAPVNAGLLCETGRFDPLYRERKRITKPLLRKNGRFEEVDWDTAVSTVAKRLGNTDSQKVGVLTSTHATNEALYLLAKLFGEELRVTNMGLLNDVVPSIAGRPAGSLEDISGCDLILLAGADPFKDQPVASCMIRRALDKGARLLIVDDHENGLASFATLNVKMSKVQGAIEVAERAQSPVVAYGAGVTQKAAKALRALKDRAIFVALEPGVNTRAATAYGLANGFGASSAEVLFLLAGEQDWDATDILAKAGKGIFLAVQVSYVSPLTERADVVLPMAIWSERAGSFTNTEGRVQTAQKAVQPTGDAKPDWEILSLLADKLGKKLGASLDEISVRATDQLK